MRKKIIKNRSKKKSGWGAPSPGPGCFWIESALPTGYRVSLLFHYFVSLLLLFLNLVLKQLKTWSQSTMFSIAVQRSWCTAFLAGVQHLCTVSILRDWRKADRISGTSLFTGG